MTGSVKEAGKFLNTWELSDSQKYLERSTKLTHVSTRHAQTRYLYRVSIYTYEEESRFIDICYQLDRFSCSNLCL